MGGKLLNTVILLIQQCMKLIYNRKIQAVCLHILHFVYLLSLHFIQAFGDCVKDLLSPFHSDSIDLVVGIDAMGFILGMKIY